jgi:hypothetical protein
VWSTQRTKASAAGIVGCGKAMLVKGRALLLLAAQISIL